MVENKKYNCLIIDDETLARQLISTHLINFPSFHVSACFNNVVDASEYLKKNEIDVLFLDIQMPRITGIEFAVTLAKNIKIIFTTAYSEYAVKGFELNAVDYLMKPITAERFSATISKLTALLELENIADSAEEFIMIKSQHELIKINTADILYVEAMHKYVKIITKEERFTTLSTLTAMEENLDKTTFYRCHRSFIINKNKINSIDANSIQIQEHIVPLSKTYKQELLEKMGQN